MRAPLSVMALTALMAIGPIPLSMARAQTAPTEQKPAAPAATRYYAVTLVTAFAPIQDVSAAQKQFPGLRVYVSRGKIGKLDAYRLRVGFFTDPAAADALKKKAIGAYPYAWVTEIPASEYARVTGDSKRAQPPKPAAAPLAATPALPAPAPRAAAAPAPNNPEVDRIAAPLLSTGREALTRGDNAAAIAAFDQLLRLPPNKYTPDAQELAGLAHERNGEIETARAEYRAYLQLYPEGEGAERVRQRLAALTAVAPTPALRAPARKETNETTVYGGLSQYYYHGASKIETTTTTPTTVDQSTLSLTDQKALVSNLDLTYRTRSENFDNRIVFRDTSVNNFLPGQDDRNRVNAAYYEVKSRPHDYLLRLGRQPGYSGGVLGRFDGALAGYAVLPKWRVNAVAGKPVDDWSIDTSRHFYGLGLDMGTFVEHWGGSVYTIKQIADGVIDRQAVGGELRYFDPKKSVYTLLDYDTAFNALNIALLQANWTMQSGTAFNLLADHRKSPALQLTNALIGEPTTSISTMLQTRSYEELKQQALALTATSDLYLLGVTQPITTQWQIGGDVRMWRISSTTGTVNQPAIPATGDVYAYTLQAIGTGVFARRDISVFSYTLIDAPTYNGHSASVTNRSRFTDKWALDTAVRWYKQTDQQGVTLTRLTPTLRVTYQWGERIALEGEIGVEDSTVKSSTTEDVTRRNYWSLGYRWDF